MKRRSVLLKQVIQKHRNKLQESFSRAKNHTKQLLKIASLSERDSLTLDEEILKNKKDFRVFIKRVLFFVVLSKDRFVIAIQKRISVLREMSENRRPFLRDIYERCIIRAEYTKRDFLFLFFVACLIGIGAKTFATYTLTMGFEDYTLPSKSILYDMHQIEQSSPSKMKKNSRETTLRGDICSDIIHL